MQGDNFQVDKVPLLNIPILLTDKEVIFIDLVDKIMTFKGKGDDSTIYETQIDNMVYKLYNLKYKEILIIEPEFSDRMSKDEYEILKF